MPVTQLKPNSIFMMKTKLTLFVAVLAVALFGIGCASVPDKLIENPIIEDSIRIQLSKPSGQLTEADLDKVTSLELINKGLTDAKELKKLTNLKALDLGINKLTDISVLEGLTNLEFLSLSQNQLTSVKSLEKLTKLKNLNLNINPAITADQIAKLQKALPMCKIMHHATK